MITFLTHTKFPFFRQMDSMDCGPTCLRMIAKHYGKFYTLPYLREKCYIGKDGVSLKGISEAAEQIGFRTIAVSIPFAGKSSSPSLLTAPMPAVAHWNQSHFVVVYKATKKEVWIADPGAGKFKLTRKEFEQHWLNKGEKGILLLLEPGINFYEEQETEKKQHNLAYLAKYLRPYRKLIFQLFLGLILGSVFTLIFPFLTQSIVDIGIQNQNIGFIYLVLLGQLMLFLGQTIVRFVQNWILLHVGVRLSVNLISDFLIKLMKLPIRFFDTRMVGDLLQRINDHKRIESFLTQSTLSVIFSVFNLIIFSIVLLIYSRSVFLIFLISAILYISWIVLFLRKRAEIDYRTFQQLSDNHSTLIELIQGMKEIKLQDSYLKRRWKWTEIQAKLFKVKINGLEVTQYQDAGALFINQSKDILITFLVAQSVITGSMTLGMMLAIQYIIGQLNVPLQQLINFIRSLQDARISLERLGEIEDQENEDAQNDTKLATIPTGDLVIKNLHFRYTPISDWVLNDVNLVIPRGKVTAIVGCSGSGKTTLLKLLLGFYSPEKGQIRIGRSTLNHIQPRAWRRCCGVVMQEGFIFSDTIGNNIAESDDRVNLKKLQHALHVSNIQEFIEDLPLGYNTMIGAKGNDVSQGQKQRLLIARAVYKDPEFIFFDEATNALDANNEKIIMENLEQFFKNRTVVVVAHRLSTVKNADQIVVIDQGRVRETGTHQELTAIKGVYYTLVKNQLELGT